VAHQLFRDLLELCHIYMKKIVDRDEPAANTQIDNDNDDENNKETLPL
jgi:hypothetical protein